MFINKLLIIISVLFALSLKSSGFGMTSRFHLVLKNCGTAYLATFLWYCGICQIFFAVMWCSEPPNVPLHNKNKM